MMNTNTNTNERPNARELQCGRQLRQLDRQLAMLQRKPRRASAARIAMIERERDQVFREWLEA